MTPEELMKNIKHLKDAQTSITQAIEYNREMAAKILPFLKQEVRQRQLDLPSPIATPSLVPSLDKFSEFDRYLGFVREFCEMFDIKEDIQETEQILDTDGYFVKPQTFEVRKPYHAFCVAEECITLLTQIKDKSIQEQKEFAIELLRDLKIQLDSALDS